MTAGYACLFTLVSMDASCENAMS
ncbi:hypothetical protein CGLO_16716 [Colletotrichum gloeosporioides Cg-14]|uniref:Uncharacterized protein n=1 Tax=Colletotrichum gloeosporioides (strain Cg-14) TaxID=1237896 RepID=T0JMZ7_COLGC|nr:hypothetical protein CGLO_16716 [Colletotrichum gloeosporioides Cg-14]